MLLSDREKQEAVGDVARMILAANRIVMVQRKSTAENLFGSDDQIFTDVCQEPIEIDEEPPIELSGKVDAVGSVLPDADVLAEDRIALSSTTYRVQAVHEEYLFGVKTHKTLHLVKLNER